METSLYTHPRAGCAWQVTRLVPMPKVSISWPFVKETCTNPRQRAEFVRRVSYNGGQDGTQGMEYAWRSLPTRKRKRMCSTRSMQEAAR